MEAFLDFFEAMPSWQKLVWIVACMSFNLVVESLRPMFQGDFRSWKHTRTNLTFLATTMAINSAFGAATVGVFAWAAINEVGLLHLFEAPTWVELVVAIVVLPLKELRIGFIPELPRFGSSADQHALAPRVHLSAAIWNVLYCKYGALRRCLDVALVQGQGCHCMSHPNGHLVLAQLWGGDGHAGGNGHALILGIGVGLGLILLALAFALLAISHALIRARPRAATRTSGVTCCGRVAEAELAELAEPEEGRVSLLRA